MLASFRFLHHRTLSTDISFNLQSTVWKKMEVVHPTTIPCEPNTANRHRESQCFGEIRPCTNDIVYARFELSRTFLCVFMSVQFKGSRMLRSEITAKCTSSHLFRYQWIMHKTDQNQVSTFF